MKAQIIDLRYRMRDILKAIDRNEKVTVLYRGKEKCVIVPRQQNEYRKIKNHPFFGMLKKSEKSVSETMENLRSGRYHDI